MPVQTEGARLGDGVLSELGMLKSRKAAVVLSGNNLGVLTVVGAVTKAQAAAPTPTVVGTGDGTMSGLLPGPAVQVGSYVITCITAVANGGVFSVVAPDGQALPNATVGVAYKSEHLDFLLNDGAADFVVDDAFTVVVTSGGTPAVQGTGNGTVSAISLGHDTKNGTYQLVCIAAATNAGTFELRSPDGDTLEQRDITGGAGGTAVFVNRQVNVTVTDGSTDFAAGDKFDILVASLYPTSGDPRVKEWDPLNVDGSQIALGILTDDYDATAADVTGVVLYKDAELIADHLVWKSGTTAAEKQLAYDQLERAGIVVREAA